MPTSLPAEPRFATESERQVWELLMAQLGDKDVVIPNQHLTTSDRDFEADFVVLMPDFGVVVLEVKGGQVWHDHGWWMRYRGEDKEIDPVRQVSECRYALRGFVERSAAWGSRARVNWAIGVVVPYSKFSDDFQLPDLPRLALHGRGDLEHLGQRVRQNAYELQKVDLLPTGDDIFAIVKALAGNSGKPDINAVAEENAALASRLTSEQASLLGVTRLLNRVEIRGGAGCGKTVLALQQAKELQLGRHERPPQRVALLCYSLGLAEYLKNQVASWPRRAQVSFVGTFHEFGRQWGAPDGNRDDGHFWESELPQLMTDLADDLDDNHKYDAIVVDEAQDFADTWWEPLMKSLRDPDDGGLYIFSDENQRLFARFGRPPVQLIPLVLDHNLRNTKQIHDSFRPLAPSHTYAHGGDGPSVRFVQATKDEAQGVADDEVDRLLDLGWEPGRIALLTTGSRHPLQLEATSFHDQEGYWRAFFADDDVFYAHVLGFKGLERPAVVLCVNEDGSRERARERLYVGMSRATDQLVVVGDYDVIRSVAGESVARRLQ